MESYTVSDRLDVAVEWQDMGRSPGWKARSNLPTTISEAGLKLLRLSLDTILVLVTPLGFSFSASGNVSASNVWFRFVTPV